MDPLFQLIQSVVRFGGKSDFDKVNTYSMSNQAEDILLSFHMIDKEAKSMTVLGKFKQYFVKCRNVIYMKILNTINMFKNQMKQSMHSSQPNTDWWKHAIMVS